MSLNTSDEAIKIAIPLRSNKINFSFYGGEPLTAIDSIRSIVSSIRSAGLEGTISLTTNLTHLSVAAADFLIANDVTVVASLSKAQKAEALEMLAARPRSIVGCG